MHVSEIKIANGEKLCSKGEEDVSIKVNVDRNSSIDVTVKDALFVPKLDGNLVSVKKLTEKGQAVLFQGDDCILIRNGHLETIAKYEDGMYKVRTYNKEERLMSSQETNNNCIYDWHLIFAHRNLADLKAMKDQGLRIKECKCSDVCETCLIGKMSRKSFPKKARQLKVFLIVLRQIFVDQFKQNLLYVQNILLLSPIFLVDIVKFIS